MPERPKVDWANCRCHFVGCNGHTAATGGARETSDRLRDDA
jgi:hypothetical protein